MRANKVLNVWYENMEVGKLALTGDKKVAFEYTKDWLNHGFSISPFSLPLQKKVFISEQTHFKGVYGVFADSLPDAWGNLLLNRMLKKNGINADDITILDRLAIVGDSGMGALRYEPEMQMEASQSEIELDELAEQCHNILTTSYSEDIEKLYGLGGTSGGARPKIMTEIDGEDWIIKFPAHVDGIDSGEMEYNYSLCAKKCGIIMPETRLFPSKHCKGYFGIKRFDRVNDNPNVQKRIHMCSVAALLEIDYNQPSLDYYELMKLVKILTKENPSDVENMYLRMCFNVFAHNRDDHAKNFSYLYDEESGRWRLSPAYDMTHSNTYYGEHTTSVDGNGKNPGPAELLAVGMKAGIPKRKCNDMIEKVQTRVSGMLKEYL